MKRKLFLSIFLCFAGLWYSSLIVHADSFNGQTPVGVGFVDEKDKKKEDEKKQEKTGGEMFPGTGGNSSDQSLWSKLLPRTGEEMKMGISVLGVLLFSGTLLFYVKRHRREQEK
ncbi:LPXTG cell wall anchor domain-containing protein [Enterococcus sp. AZ196]|uniref:LPXTG cell wall anchor domain-containing protein n=1 Tax=Enterococcus sp. AZ196 TaxID=2774659 RepID=UPI003D2E6CF8